MDRFRRRPPLERVDAGGDGARRLAGLAFDTLDDYERYAWNVVEAEREADGGTPSLLFFSLR